MISEIKKAELPITQYFPRVHQKKQIVLHHTVSGPSAKNVQSFWAKTPERVGTAFIIDGKGDLFQCFSSTHWAHHLGTWLHNNLQLNQQSIGIEICNWGGLKERRTKYYSITGKEIPSEQVVDYGIEIHGFRYYQKYLPSQLETLRTLLLYLSEKHQIPLTYHSDIWNFSLRAITGHKGIFTHVSYRKDKSDCHPQLELVKMLKSLEGSCIGTIE